MGPTILEKKDEIFQLHGQMIRRLGGFILQAQAGRFKTAGHFLRRRAHEKPFALVAGVIKRSHHPALVADKEADIIGLQLGAKGRRVIIRDKGIA